MAVMAMMRTYYDESVLAFVLVQKSGKFQIPQGEQHTRHLVFGVLTQLLLNTHNTGVGYCLFVV